MMDKIDLDLSNIKAIKNDSRKVLQGDLYIATAQDESLARQFIFDAINNGALAIVLDKRLKIEELPNIAYYYSENPTSAASRLASIMYPLQSDNIVACTGTNGKTSVSNFYLQLAQAAGKRSAAIGTLGILLSDDNIKIKNSDTILTTPDAINLHYILNQLALQKVTHVALEASSHGLIQHRMHSVNLKAAAFTNFSQDHLDYHGTMDSYFNAKLILFRDIIKPNAVSVLNSDIPEFDKLKSICKERNTQIIEYGRSAKDLKFLSLEDGYITVNIFDKKYKILFPLQYEFQVYNILAAIGLGLAVDLNLDDMLSYLPAINAAPGRLELVRVLNGASIYVDYAHTPDGLKTVLLTLRERCVRSLSKLHVLFGCGGDRDKGKRAAMAEIAESLADYIIVTDDNPRNEDPALIRSEILSSIKDKTKVLEIGDKELATRTAVSKLNHNDILLIAGKGHEDYQIIGSKRRFYSDRAIVLSI